MPNPRGETGEKNLVGKQLKMLRKVAGISQRDLAHRMQLNGMDIDNIAVASYGEIKKWFLDKYENVADFGRNNINKILGKTSA